MAQNLDPLQTSFVQKPQWLVFATETNVEEKKNHSKNENIVKSTGFWLFVWCIDKEIKNY